MHTPYDRFTDAEFVVILERQEESDLLNSMIKRLTEDREAALEAAKIEGWEGGEETGAAEAIADFQRDRPKNCVCGEAIEYDD